MNAQISTERSVESETVSVSVPEVGTDRVRKMLIGCFVRKTSHKRRQNLSENQVRGSLEAMLDKGYVYKDNNQGRVKYQPSPFASEDQVSKNITLDFQTVVDETKAVVRDVLREDVAQEYIEQYCEGEGLITTHPLSGEQINITEQDLLDDVAEQVDEEVDVLDESDPYSSDDDDDGMEGGGLDEFEDGEFSGMIG